MICESEHCGSEVAFDSKVIDGESLMSSKTSYTIGELLSQAEVNVTKETPTEFDRSIVSGTNRCFMEGLLPDIDESKLLSGAPATQSVTEAILQYSRKRKRGRSPHSENEGNVNKWYEAAANDIVEDQLKATATSGQGEGQGSTDMSLKGAASASASASASTSATASYADVVRRSPVSTPRHVSRPPIPMGLKHPQKWTLEMTNSTFVLSLSHQKGVHQIGRMTRTAANELPELSNFSVHWLMLEPQSIPPGKATFDYMVPRKRSALYQRLLRCMPTFTYNDVIVFWEHEWICHGEQPVYTQEQYFHNCCVLRDFFDFRQMLSAEVDRLDIHIPRVYIADRDGKTYCWRSLKAKDLVNIFSKDPRLQQCSPLLYCVLDKGKWFLVEIHVKLDCTLQHVKHYSEWRRGGFTAEDIIHFFVE